MKTRMTVFFLMAFLAHIRGQVTCAKLQFSYDNAGNRIQRKTVSLPCLIGDPTDVLALNAIKQDNNSTLSTQLSKTELKAYPNPNSGIFQVLIDNPQENAVLDLYDFTGRKVYSLNAPSANVSMNLSNLVTGSYMLMYRNPEKILGKLKLVIE
jgi:Secretion system C-terminal sorting domain